MISGSWPGGIFFFRRLVDGTFAEPVAIEHAGGEPIDVGRASAVFAADWTGNGFPDLIIGTISGAVFLVPNQGSGEGEAGFSFGPAEPIQVAGEPLVVGGRYGGPAVADWDGDGLPDLLLGAGDGSVVWYRNTGEPGRPALEQARTLVPPADRNKDVGLRPFSRAKIAVADWTGNGRLDLLVGDFASHAVQLSAQEQALLQELRAEATALRAELRRLAPAAEQAGEAEASEAARRREEIQETLRVKQAAMPRMRVFSGNVWLYARKDPRTARAR